jgi:hypothetical protein
VADGAFLLAAKWAAFENGSRVERAGYARGTALLFRWTPDKFLPELELRIRLKQLRPQILLEIGLFSTP